MIFKYSAIAAVILAVGLSTNMSTNAHALEVSVKYKQKFKYFKVRGKTSREIFRDFQKKSPIKAKGPHDATLGVASISMSPEVKYETKGNRCRVAKATVKTDVVIHLPRWANYRSADRIAKLSWDTLFDDIKRHELQHAAIARDYANRIQRKIDSFGSRSSCASLERALSRSSHKLLIKHDKAQKKFDRSEYRRLLKARKKKRTPLG